MKKILTIIISLLILISSAGCLEKKSKIGSITGYVTTDGNTSSGVTVAVENFSIRTTTNSSGYYSLTGILEGQYSIRFSKSCYSNVSINVTVVGGANTTANLVNLSSSLGSISGTARLEGQYDYTGISVSILGTTLNALTDSSGYYYFSNLTTGNISLVFSKSGYNTVTINAQITQGNTTQATLVNLSIASSPGTTTTTLSTSTSTSTTTIIITSTTTTPTTTTTSTSTSTTTTTTTTSTTTTTIIIYTYNTQWGEPGSGDGQFDLVNDIAINASGYMYVTDSNNNRVQKFDSNRNYISQWGTYGSGDGQFSAPEGIAISPSGDIYVADGCNHRVQKFDPDGNYILQWDYDFWHPMGLAVDTYGNVYVSDSNGNIKKFDSNGTYLTGWGGYGTEDGKFDYPYGIAIDSFGYIYIVDTNNNRIQKFDSDGNFKGRWGVTGNQNGQFHHPKTIDINSRGHVFVTDSGNDRIQIFDTYGIYLAQQWIDPVYYISFPVGISSDENNNIYVVCTFRSYVLKFSTDF